MAKYDIEPIYPILACAPNDTSNDQTYRIDHIRAIEHFLNSEVVERERLYKKFHRCEVVARYLEQGLIASGIVAGGGSIAALCTGVGIPLSVCLAAVSITTSIATSITKQALKIYNTKDKKHSDICNAATTILNGITSYISQAIQDGDVSSREFDKIIAEKQRYLQLKKSIRSKVKKLVKEINDIQKQELLEIGRQQGREQIAKKLVSNSDIQPVNVI